jgi:AmmeMemoRadiSam system protein B
MATRRTAVAGTWYPSTASRLAAEVSRYVDASDRQTAGTLPAKADLIALISPHAGLMYSGPIAAYGYGLLESRHYDAVVLVGPSHYVGFEGASIWPGGEWETPLGHLRVDDEAARRLLAATDVIQEVPAAHEREHSLEMQLPFLATFAADTPIVPIVMGFQTAATATAVGDAIAEVARGRRMLLIASSDLSHFYDAPTAGALDRKVIERVDAFDPEGLMTLLEQRPDHACGGGPMVAVLRAARALGATRSQVLQYGDSGDVSGNKDSVVGYLSAAVWR